MTSRLRAVVATVIARRRGRRLAAPGLGLAALLAGCGGPGPDGGAQPEAADGPPARLVVEQRRAVGSPIPPEGSFGFFELRGDAPQPVASGNIPTTDRTVLFDGSVAPGGYTLVAYQRPCAEDCRRLDEPTDSCESDLSLEPRERVAVVVTVRHGEGCTIQRR